MNESIILQNYEGAFLQRQTFLKSYYSPLGLTKNAFSKMVKHSILLLQLYENIKKLYNNKKDCLKFQESLGDRLITFLSQV